MKITINNKISFDNSKAPLTIAEISANHEGKKEKLLKHIISAAKCGCELVKIQTYEPEDLTLKSQKNSFLIKDGIWKNKNLWELYKKAQTPFEWHYDAFKIAKKNNITLISTPFSLRALNFLKQFDPPIYKISSFEITDLKLIYEIAKLKKPILMSTGLATIPEIKKALKIINKFHNKVIIFYCVSGYPTPHEDVNLNNINLYKKIFPKNLIGLSDHTNSIDSSLAAIPFGIVAIEKHYKLADKNSSPDSQFSISTKEMGELNKRKKMYNLMLGREEKKLKKSEIKSRIFRRSLFASQNIKKGEIITKNNIKSLRPKIGLCSSYYFEIIGKKAKKNILKNSSIFKKDIF